MANALQTLFSNIATSIRGGLPDEGAMSPYSFPEKIDEIVAQMGSGGSDDTGGGLSIGLCVNDQDKAYGTLTTTEKYSFDFEVPKDANNLYLVGKIKVSALSNSSAMLAQDIYTFNVVVNPADMIETDLGNGRKKVTMFTVAFDEYAGAAGYGIHREFNYCYTMPNVFIKDNILYAGEGCEGFFHRTGTLARKNPFYLEGVDLRGSKIKKLLWGTFSNVKEMKKIWFPETLEVFESYAFNGCTGLEEVHFTSEIPPDMSAVHVCDNLPKTCKIYVPTGTLDAYTSASGYPDPATYTYIEE